jgi:chlorite dismutase
MAVVSSKRSTGRSRTFPQQLAYTAYATYKAVFSSTLLAREDRGSLSAQAVQTLASVPQVALRGTYDTSGYQSGADLLLWLAAPTPDALQDALAAFRQTPLACAFEPIWSAFAVHRTHDLKHWSAAAYFRGEAALRYVCVCPTNHTPEWHALAPQARRRVETDRDRMLRQYGDVLISSVNATGLGPYETILTLEASELGRLVDVIDDLGSTEGSRYVSGPLMAIAGVRKPLGEIVDMLP